MSSWLSLKADLHKKPRRNYVFLVLLMLILKYSTINNVKRGRMFQSIQLKRCGRQTTLMFERLIIFIKSVFGCWGLALHNDPPSSGMSSQSLHVLEAGRIHLLFPAKVKQLSG
ncbi:hypothetical protein CU041_04480 [Thalassospira povalilytica]|uniref:Uncharacterized protein n=1 Tax=Thalassospira povalilytica TaxID=732237 RepID=A0ABX4RAH9_9PROT|nr:hypothetical protein CU041_04480 [Thalassospira povalilytica]